MTEGVIVETVPARAALAGNPSDGYGGAVLATPVRGAAATVTLRPGDHFEIDGRRVAGWDDVTAAPDGPIGRGELVLGAIRAYTSIVAPDPFPPCSIDVETTIPRSVGLAGSSAIVIAALRAVAGHAGRPVLDPDALAVVALAAEVEQLGLTAGLQDRVVQSFDATVHMEFGADVASHRYGRPSGRYDVVTTDVPGRLFVAHRRASGSPSDATHRPLRERYETGESAVVEAMAELAAQARSATAAVRAGDAAALGSAMNRSFDLRRSIVPLDPAHVEMVRRARLAGAAANYSGSGGAITVLAPDAATAGRAEATLTAIGCEILPVGP